MDYKETSGTGSSWTRAYEITVYNPFTNPNKSIEFFEEELTVLGDRVLSNKTGSASTYINIDSDINNTFDLLHPETGAIIGQASYAQLYTILHSLYMKTAVERDILVAETERIEVDRRSQ